MTQIRLTLRTLPWLLAISRMTPDSKLPEWAMAGPFRSICWTPDELSIVCEDSLVPEGVSSERGWRGLMVEGPLDFGLTGILAAVAEPLARAGISIFAISTFDTDYFLVREASFPHALRVLVEFGHSVR